MVFGSNVNKMVRDPLCHFNMIETMKSPFYVVSKVEKINHKDHKELTQSSQTTKLHCFNFVTFVYTLCTLWLKMTFETSLSFKRRLL